MKFGATLLAVLAGMLYASTALGWTGPPGSPPTCPVGNSACSPPINTSSTAQTKTGVFTGSGGVVGTSAGWGGNFTGAGNNGGVYGAGGYYGVAGTGANIGVQGTGPTGVLGVGTTLGVSGTGPTGVYGTGTTYGVHGNGGTSAVGVYGNSTNGFGVRGASTNTYAGYFSGAYGLYGEATGASSYGVYGRSPSIPGFFYNTNTLAYAYLGYTSGGQYYGLFTPNKVYANDYYLAATGKWLSGGSTFYGFGGLYTYRGPLCYIGNPFTGDCNCPSGYLAAQFGGAQFSDGSNAGFYMCYR